MRRLDAKLVVSILAMVAYAAVARGVDNLYPFSTFSMYSGVFAQTASRIAARGADGALREVSEYEAWDLPPLHADPCGGDGAVYTIPYVDEEASHWIEAHRGQGGEPVELVRHVWRLSGQAVGEEDCVIYRAKASRR